MRSFPSIDTLGLYIQIPFCASKCSFCNFGSQVARRDALARYCDALEREITRLPALHAGAGVGQRFSEHVVDTVYWGGGTPPLVGTERLEQILQSLREHFRFGPDPEFTLEATPGSADRKFMEAARALGVNRLSIGAQSFDDRELRAVGRLHSADETRNMAAQARATGFDNISLDLIAGLPFQTEESWRQSLEAVADLQPEHVSIYLFEVDEKSRLGGEVLRHGTRYHADVVPDDDFMAGAYESARRLLQERGYRQYEVSNFALPGRESRHNRKYWRREPYVGLGAGAHSFDGESRWANEANAETYSAKLTRGESPIVELHRLTPEEQIEEFFFLGLRQSDGVDLSEARQHWGAAAFGRMESLIGELAGRRLLTVEADCVRLADDAFLISNEVFQEFVMTSAEAT